MQFPTCSATWQRPIVWRSLSDYRSLIASRSIDTIPWCQLRISGHVDDATALPRRMVSGFKVGHDDAVDSGPCTQ